MLRADRFALAARPWGSARRSTTRDPARTEPRPAGRRSRRVFSGPGRGRTSAPRRRLKPARFRCGSPATRRVDEEDGSANSSAGFLRSGRVRPRPGSRRNGIPTWSWSSSGSFPGHPAGEARAARDHDDDYGFLGSSGCLRRDPGEAQALAHRRATSYRVVTMPSFPAAAAGPHRSLGCAVRARLHHMPRLDELPSFLFAKFRPPDQDEIHTRRAGGCLVWECRPPGIVKQRRK